VQKLYGYNPGERAKNLMNVYDRCYRERDCGDQDRIAANQAEFQEAIADEIAWFERRQAAHLQARAELKVPSLDAEMLNTQHSPATVAIYHERLERAFAEKWRLLKEYRASHAGEDKGQQTDDQQTDHQQESPDTEGPIAVQAGVVSGSKAGLGSGRALAEAGASAT
jgi:hypothetical protein